MNKLFVATLFALIFSLAASPALADTITVTPGDMAVDIPAVVAEPTSWFFYNDESDTIDNSLGTFVTGPDDPFGEGSVEISVSGTQRRNLATSQFGGTPLASITDLRFSTYNPSAGNGGSVTRSAYLNFNVDFDGSGTWQSRLAYVPRQNSAVVQDTWQEWDAIDSGSALWWWSRYASNGNMWPDGNTTEYRTWDDLIASFPSIQFNSGALSWLGLRVGEPYASGYTENVDKFVFGTVAGTTTWDFELFVPPPASTGCAECGDEYTLEAVKTFGPSTWYNGELDLCQEATFTLPEKVDIVEGNAEDHWAELTYNDDGTPVTCLWQGDIYTGGTGLEYDNFMGCVENYNGDKPVTQSTTGLMPGDSFTTDYLELFVAHGDSSFPLVKGAVTLDNEAACVSQEDDVDVMWTYGGWEDKLFVRGYAPEGALSASIRWSGIDDNSGVPNPLTWQSSPWACLPVDQDASPEFLTYAYQPQADGWNEESYTLNVYFFNNTNCEPGTSYANEVSPRAYGGEFNYLELLALWEELDELLATINDTNSSLYQEVYALWNATYDLETNLTDLQNEVDDLRNQVLDLQDEVDVQWRFGAWEDKLFIQGYGPDNAQSVSLRFKALSDNSNPVWPPYCTSFDADANPEFKTFVQPGADGWANDSYQFWAWFHDAPNCGGSEISPRAYGGEFNYLEILALWADLEELLETLEDVNETLYNEVYALWNDSIEQGEDIAELQAEVNSIWDTLAAANAGTINLQLYGEESTWNPDSLFVWGEAPQGATTATVFLRDIDRNVIDEITVTVQTNQENNNTYRVFFTPISDYDPLQYTILVRFYDNGDWMRGYDLGALFNNLWLQHIDYALFGDPNACYELGFPINLLGEIPEEYRQDTTWKLLSLLGNYIGNDYTYGDMCDVIGALATYLGDGESLTSFAPLGLNEEYYAALRCIGYDEQIHLNTLWNTCQANEIALLERFSYGFNVQSERTFETFMQEESFERTFTYSFNPQFSGELFGSDDEYSIYLVQEWSNNDGGYNITQQLSSCQEMQRAQWNTFSHMINLPATWPDGDGEGRYRVHLEAMPCDYTPLFPMYVSNTFVIEIDDLAAPWNPFAVEVVDTTPGVENFAEGVFWTASSEVEATGMLGNETEWMNDLRCEVWAYNDEAQSKLYERWDFTEDNNTMCEGDVELTDLEPTTDGSAPLFNIELCAHPIFGQVECDLVTFGYDTTPPSINFIYPGEEDELSGVHIFTTDVTDDGVIKSVNISVVEKDNASNFRNFGLATFNNTSGLWEISVNTSEVIDGFYNITVEAYDYAGNYAFGELDPLFDNTDPIIVDVLLSGFVGQDFMVESTITDNLAGVLNANVEVYSFTCDAPTQECSVDWCEVDGNSTECGFTSTCDEAVSACSEGDESCYQAACSGFGASNATNFTDVTVTCNALCAAEQTCTNRTYSGSPVDSFALDLTSGTSFNGVWSGSSNYTYQEGVRYEARVNAQDGAGNDADESTGDAYGRLGYTVTVDATNNNPPFPTGATLDVVGTVTASDGSPATGNVLMQPGGVTVALTAVGYMTEVEVVDAPTQEVTATYVPDATCDQSFSASTSVSTFTSGSGGGGGGGGTWVSPTSQPVDDGGEDEQPEQESSEETTETQSGGEGEQTGEQTPTQTGGEGEVVEETTSDNLITGAVTGAGFFEENWPWLAVLAGLILLLLVGYRLAKK